MQRNSNLNNRPSQNEMVELESLFKQNELDKLEKKIGKLIYTYPKIPILYKTK